MIENEGYCYISIMNSILVGFIVFNINPLFADSEVLSSIAI